MSTSAQRQFLVKVEGVDGYFATKGGGESESETRKVWNGGSLQPEVLGDPAEVGDVTITRPYSATRDAPVQKRLQPLTGRWRTTVTVTPTDADLVPVADPTVYSNALLRRVGPPEHDAASGDPSVLELVFTPEGVR